MPAKLLIDYFPIYFSRLRGYGSRMAGDDIPKDKFVQALDLMNEKLRAIDKTLTFLCVGGGAMMLALDARNKTQDLDGTLIPGDPETVKLFHRLAAEVGREVGISEGWINLEVKNIMSGQRFRRDFFELLPQYSYSNLHLLFAKPAYLLSMKVQAMREGRKDFGDIAKLCQVLGIRTLSAMEAAIEPYGGWDYIGNDEFVLLKLAIAWAFPGATEYEQIRLNALKARNHGTKAQQSGNRPDRVGDDQG